MIVILRDIFFVSHQHFELLAFVGQWLLTGGMLDQSPWNHDDDDATHWFKGGSVGADRVWLCWNAGTREYDDIAVLDLTSRPPTPVYPCSTPSLIPSHFSVVPPPQVIHRPLNRLQRVPWWEQGTKVGRIQGPTNTSLPCYIRRLVADILVFKVGLGDKKSVWQPSPPAEQGRQGTGDLSQQKNFKEKYSKTYVGDSGQKRNYPKPHNLNHLSRE